MKKYYATEAAPEWFDYEIYYDESRAEEDHIWIGGNRNFIEINEDFRKTIVKNLEDCAYDIGIAIDEATDADLGGVIDQAALEVKENEVVKYYFTKNDKTPLSETELHDLVILAREFVDGTYSDENSTICKVLELLYGEPFLNSTITGSSQGDWLRIIYPESRAAIIPFIEAVMFATGTEFIITTEPIELAELEDADCFHDYTELWKDEDVRAWLCATLSCKSEELVIRKISDQHTHITYEYKEV